MAMLNRSKSSPNFIPTTKGDWNDIMSNVASLNKEKIWAFAKTLKPTPVDYCSDRTTYHSMTIPRNTDVYIGEMPETIGESSKWCVYFRRGKGYNVVGFYSTAKAKQLFQSKIVEGELVFEHASAQKSISRSMIETLKNGITPKGTGTDRVLSPTGVSPTYIKNIETAIL
jgi:hypothetical protein